MMDNKKAESSLPFVLKGLVLVVGLIVVSAALSRILPQTSDWSDVYRPAAINLITGKSPFAIHNYVAPPWVLIPIIPLAVLPEQIGRVAIFWITISSFAFLAKKNGANIFCIIALIISYPVVYGLIYGQIDWLAMFGILLPPWLGLIFLMAKPQIGIGVALFLGYEAWAGGGIKKLVSIFLPLACLVIVSYIVFGSDLFTKSNLVFSPTNTSLWPRSIPIGLVILVAAVRHKKKFLSMTASPFLSPYLSIHSWASAIVGLSDDPVFPIVISVCTWVIWALGGGAVNG
ncbi:MAG: hypothetical protein ABSA10_02380 [Anaerolineales bacterium]|jgi:hypothetical protein